MALNEVVRLPCPRPPRSALVSWTSSRFQKLPGRSFLQASDGSLSFLASADTFGSYRCSTQEDGFSEQLAGFQVLPAAAPRALSPPPGGDQEHVPVSRDQVTEEPTSPTAGGAEELPEPEDDLSTSRVDPGSGADPGWRTQRPPGRTGSAHSAGQDRGAPAADTSLQRSFYAEMVALALLLAACVLLLLLAAFQLWRRRDAGLKTPSTPEDGDVTEQSVPSLSGSQQHQGQE